MWRNDEVAAQGIRKRDLFFAALGTMAFSVVLGVSLVLIASQFSYSTIGHRYGHMFGGLFALSPILSWYGLIFGSAFFFAAALQGYAGWLSTAFFGMAGSTLLYVPFFYEDIHPVVLVLFGGATAFIFWMFIKVICKDGLIPVRRYENVT